MLRESLPLDDNLTQDGVMSGEKNEYIVIVGIVMPGQIHACLCCAADVYYAEVDFVLQPVAFSQHVGKFTARHFGVAFYRLSRHKPRSDFTQKGRGRAERCPHPTRGNPQP